MSVLSMIEAIYWLAKLLLKALLKGNKAVQVNPKKRNRHIDSVAKNEELVFNKKWGIGDAQKYA